MGGFVAEYSVDDVVDHAPAAMDQRAHGLDSKRGAWTGVAKPGRNTRGQLGTNTDFAPRGHRDKPAGPAKPTFDEAKRHMSPGVPVQERATDKLVGRVSGRAWKEVQTAPSRISKSKLGTKAGWVEKMAKKRERDAFQKRKKAAAEARNEAARSTRRAMREAKERKAEKAKEAMVVQRISNTRKLKTMSRKERQKLVTVDEAQVVNPRRRD